MQQFQIGDPSAVAPARRGINTLAAELGFDTENAGRASLVATEIGTNLVKHGGGGELIAQPICRGERMGLELLGLDKGPGIEDVARCLRDGYSTGSSPGTGLGAIERLSQRFEIYSRPGLGTAVLAQLWPEGREPAPGLTQMGALVVPKRGETSCGDRWCYHERVEGILVAGIDGLGHGLGAEQAATEACRIFEAEKHRPSLRLMQLLHEGLRSTRGAAVTLLEVDWDAGRISSVGVGNVAAAMLHESETKRIATDNGIVGHVIPRPRELIYQFQPGTVVVMHSDGLTANWQASRYPGLIHHHASLIAGVLYRDCQRGRDDSLVVVIRRTPS